MTKCLHRNLQASVDAGAIGADGSNLPLYYVAEVRIRCADCGMPFVFTGKFAEPVYSVPDQPFIQDKSAPATKLCLPLHPAPEAKRWFPRKVN